MKNRYAAAAPFVLRVAQAVWFLFEDFTKLGWFSGAERRVDRSKGRVHRAMPISSSYLEAVAFPAGEGFARGVPSWCPTPYFASSAFFGYGSLTKYALPVLGRLPWRLGR